MNDLTYHQTEPARANLNNGFLYNRDREEESILRVSASCQFSKGAFIEFFEYTLRGDMNKALEIWPPSRTDTSSGPKVDETLKKLADNGIVVPNPEEVTEYLRRYDDMLELVLEVCQLTRGCFSPATQLSLEVYHDPEIEDEYLTLYVRQEDYEKDILKKIKTILEGYGEVLADKSGWFLVTTDFQPPK